MGLGLADTVKMGAPSARRPARARTRTKEGRVESSDAHSTKLVSRQFKGVGERAKAVHGVPVPSRLKPLARTADQADSLGAGDPSLFRRPSHQPQRFRDEVAAGWVCETTQGLARDRQPLLGRLRRRPRKGQLAGPPFHVPARRQRSQVHDLDSPPCWAGRAPRPACTKRPAPRGRLHAAPAGGSTRRAPGSRPPGACRWGPAPRGEEDEALQASHQQAV